MAPRPGWRRRLSPLRTRLRYRFDNALSRGALTVIAYLALLTLAFIFSAGLIATLAGLRFENDHRGFAEAMYQSLLRMLDPGTFAGDSAWQLRTLSLVVTLVGVILGGSLIGLIANAVDQRVARLQQGRGRIVERGHSLILGWSPQVPSIISELVIANESERRSCVVVLACAEKFEMDSRIHQVVTDTKTTRVVVRNGDPSIPSDLERVCIQSAKSVIAVRDEGGDASVIKAVLAARALDPKHAACHVVAEVQDPHDAQTLRTVSAGRVVTVSSEVIMAEVTAQACYQSGLAAVFSDLLDFDGDEIYFISLPEVVGHRYWEAQVAVNAGCVIGRLRSGGDVELNPPANTVLENEDQLIVVASDDAAISFRGFTTFPHTAPDPIAADAALPVRVLVVGWSTFGERVLSELDQVLVAGSHIHVVVDSDLTDAETITGLTLEHATLSAAAGHGGPEDLLQLRDGRFDQVIVLAYRDALSGSDADARTLLTLLTLRLMWPLEASVHVRILAELVAQSSATIAAPAGVDDLIISDALASRMMAQLSERPQLASVFGQLFSPLGPVVLMLPADQLVSSDPVPFGAVIAAASEHGASAFGYRVAATGRVVLNPSKAEVLEFAPNDKVIAIGPRRTSGRLAQRPSRAVGSEPVGSTWWGRQRQLARALVAWER